VGKKLNMVVAVYYGEEKKQCLDADAVAQQQRQRKRKRSQRRRSK